MEEKNTGIVDYDILGETDEFGNLKRHIDRDALISSIIHWATSFQGDVRNHYSYGGYLTQNLYKPMSESTREDIIHSLTDGFYQQYFPKVKVLDIKVEPDYNKKTWEIYINVYSYFLREEVDMSFKVKNLV